MRIKQSQERMDMPFCPIELGFVPDELNVDTACHISVY